MAVVAVAALVREFLFYCPRCLHQTAASTSSSQTRVTLISTISLTQETLQENQSKYRQDIHSS